MTISEYPQQLDDKFISALLQQVPYIVLSIDIEPVETEDAFKEIDNAQMKTDAEKVRFNKKSVENLDFTSSVPRRQTITADSPSCIFSRNAPLTRPCLTACAASRVCARC